MKFLRSEWTHCCDKQAAVVQWVLDDTGSLELLARAGCGKTYTLEQAIAAIVKYNLGDIAVMAYNKSIATELKVKLEKAKYDWKIVQAGTVHSFGFNVWRKIAPNVKVDNDKLWNIISHCSADIDGEMFLENGSVITKLVSLAKQQALGHLSSIENMNLWLNLWDHFNLEDDVTEHIQAEDIIRCAMKVYKISLNECRKTIDFDDMILAPLYFKARFYAKDWVMVDESQDTNPARRALALAMLKPRIGRMIFVGDPAQAIYGFTGADSDSMNLLKQATSAKTLPLNVTRRCPKLVVEQAKKIVSDFQAHEDAPEGTVRKIDYEMLESEPLTKNDVIICRNTAPLISTAYTLIAKGVACRVEGREIGTGLIKLARRWKVKTLDHLLNRLDNHVARQTAKFMSKNQEYRVEALVDQVDCLKVVITRCTLAKKNSVEDLVNDIEQMFGNTPDGQKPDVLTLSTIHKSKGREWDKVYILGRNRYMPSPYAKKDWQIQQERNLEYVAITRTKRELIDVTAST